MDRGRLLYEYRPPRAHPIIYAGMLVFGVVFVMGAIENLLRENRPELYAWYAAPLVAMLVLFLLGDPNSTRIHEHGIAPARPRLLRWYRPYTAWADLVAVYPSFYDVTGAFVSPFASSDGKVTQMGLGLEYGDKRTETVRFTPTRFTMWASESVGYKGALKAVRHAFGGRPLVTDATTYTEEEAKGMIAEASKPFLPFFAIVFLFASAAPILWVLVNFTSLAIPISLMLAVSPPLMVSTQSFVRSRHRNRVLDALSKGAEYRRYFDEAKRSVSEGET